MTGELTPEQIVTRIEAAFLPHKAEARIHDYEAKITFKVWSAKDGSHLYTFPNLPVHELQTEHYLKDIIDGTRRQVEAKVKHGIQ